MYFSNQRYSAAHWSTYRGHCNAGTHSSERGGHAGHEPLQTKLQRQKAHAKHDRRHGCLRQMTHNRNEIMERISLWELDAKQFRNLVQNDRGSHSRLESHKHRFGYEAGDYP